MFSYDGHRAQKALIIIIPWAAKPKTIELNSSSISAVRARAAPSPAGGCAQGTLLRNLRGSACPRDWIFACQNRHFVQSIFPPVSRSRILVLRLAPCNLLVLQRASVCVGLAAVRLHSSGSALSLLPAPANTAREGGMLLFLCSPFTQLIFPYRAYIRALYHIYMTNIVLHKKCPQE